MTLKLKFSPGLLVAALMYIMIGLSSVALWLALWSYSIGLATIVFPTLFIILIGWAVLIILWCMKYDRQRSMTRLLAHHREALESDEGRPTDQP